MRSLKVAKAKMFKFVPADATVFLTDVLASKRDELERRTKGKR